MTTLTHARTATVAGPVASPAAAAARGTDGSGGSARPTGPERLALADAAARPSLRLVRPTMEPAFSPSWESPCACPDACLRDHQLD